MKSKSPVGVLALVTAVAGVGLDVAFPGRWYALAAYGVAAVLALSWAVLARRRLGAWVGRRSTRMGAHSVLLAGVFAAVLVMVNVLAVRHPVRIDLSETRAFTLAPQSVKVVKALKDDVRITGFFQKGSEAESKFKDLLTLYRLENQKVSGETVDLDAHPAIAKQYAVTQFETIVLESGGREARVRSVSEQELTNALIRVSKSGKKRIAVLDGHGEPSISDTDVNGFSQGKEALERQGYEVTSLLLAQTGAIDPGIAVLIVADPQRPLLPQEISALKTYLSNGGGLLLLLGPGRKTGIEDFSAQQLGLTFREDTVIDADPFSRLAGGDYTRPIVRTYGDHEITRDLPLATAFPLAQSLAFQSSRASDVDYHPLAMTTQDSWGETQIVDGKARFDAGQDTQGPLDIAAVLTAKPSATQTSDETGAKPVPWRAVVFGNARFATNAFSNMLGNGDLFAASINWLAKDEDLIAIRPKEASSSPLILTAGQQRTVFWMPVVLVPGAIAVYGIGMWRRRRRL